MNVNQILEKAAAFDALASRTSTKKNTPDEAILDAAAEEILQKAAAFDELVAGVKQEELEKEASDDTQESEDAEADLILQKAAAYDDLLLDKMADEIIEKAAAYDKLLQEAMMEEAIQKAAAYDKLMQESEAKKNEDELAKEAYAKKLLEKAKGAGKRYMELMRGGNKERLAATRKVEPGEGLLGKGRKEAPGLQSERRQVLAARIGTGVVGAGGLAAGAAAFKKKKD